MVFVRFIQHEVIIYYGAFKVLCKVIDSLFFPNHDSVVKVIELVSSASVKKEEFFSKDPDSP